MRAPTASEPLPKRTALLSRVAVLDLFERAIVAILFLRFAWVFSTAAVHPSSALSALLVLGEALPFICIMARRPSATLSRRPTDWLFGVLGTTLPLLVAPADVHPFVPLEICFAVMLLGTFAQVSAKAVLGRRFGLIAANHGVVTAGPYRFVRHPMYAGYTMTHIGFLLATPSVGNAVLYAVTLGIQIVRIRREEHVLKHDASYIAFAGRVRYRLIPGLF